MLITKLYRLGFKGNYWLWFHIMAGGVFSACFKLIGMPSLHILFFILVGAIGWEIIEFFRERDTIKIYGTMERWLYDSAGDILGAFIMALCCVI